MARWVLFEHPETCIHEAPGSIFRRHVWKNVRDYCLCNLYGIWKEGKKAEVISLQSVFTAEQCENSFFIIQNRCRTSRNPYSPLPLSSKSFSSQVKFAVEVITVDGVLPGLLEPPLPVLCSVC